MTHEELYKKYDQEVVSDHIYGRSDTKFRHTGQFTENNPYYQQLLVGQHNNQDADALYSQAVEWQANYFSTLESREYNDPLADIERKRRAGYNPDLAGASGVSSGSSGSAGSAVPASQSGVPYSNVYGNVQSVSEGITAVCNVVNSIATLGTASVNAFEQIKTMPSRVSLAESQAYIADQTKDTVVGQTKGQDIFQRLSLVKQLSGFFTPESTSDDYVNILGTLGYSADEIPSYEQAIKNYHSNPLYQSNYQDGVRRANDLSAYNSIYTTDVQADLYERSLAIQNAEQNITTLSNQIRTSFLDYLSSNGFGDIVASNEVASANLTSKDIEFSRTKLERDVQVFSKNMADIKNEIKRMDARIQAIKGKATAEHRFLSASEQFEIDTLSNLRSQMLTLGSTQLQNFYSMVNQANAIIYQNDQMFGPDGYPLLDALTPRYMRTIDVTFGNYVKSDALDLSSVLLSLIPKSGK